MALHTEFSDTKKAILGFSVFNYGRLKCVNVIWDILYMEASLAIHSVSFTDNQFYVMNYSINSFTGASKANLLVQGILFCVSETILKTFENISETFWSYCTAGGAGQGSLQG